MKKNLLLILTILLLLIYKGNNALSQNLVAEPEVTVDCTCPGNLIQNPSFENVSSGSNLANWTTTVGNAARVSGTLVSNCSSLKVCGTYIGAVGNPSGSYTGSGNSTTYQDVTLIAGAAYNFSVYAGRTDAACTPTIKLIFYNGTSEISGQTKTISVTKNAYIDCGLANYTLTGNAPANTTKARVELKTTCGYLKIDAMCFTVCKYAGTDGSTTICENSSTTINLNNLITGENTGGTWTKTAGTGSVSSSGTFTPAVNGGPSTVTCKYTVTGFSNGTTGGTCTDESIVTITISEENQVGQNKEVTICDNDLSGINLFSKLDAGYTTGGTWTKANGSMGSLSGSTFTPVAGNYSTVLTYSVPASGTCPAKSVTVTVIVKPKANAGIDGSTTVCDNSTVEIDLFSLLTGSPQTGGTWSNGTGKYTPTVGATNPQIFTYTITGTAPCANDESTVTINIVPQANAGIDGAKEVCDNSTVEIDLFSLLTGSPQTGGTWSNGTGKYTPTIGATSPQVFTYTITGTAPCANDESTVTITTYPSAISINAGPDGEVCAHLASQELPDGSLGQTTPKKYQLAGQMTGATSVMWSDIGAGGSFDDATKLNALYTPPIGGTFITLTLTSNDPEGPCGPVSDEMVLEEVACAGILDPCTCHEVAYLPSEVMEVEDFIEIDGATGQEWTVIVNGGSPRTPAQGGGVYGTMQLIDDVPPMDNVPVPLGTVVPETPAGSGIYRYDFAHDSGAGYNVTVKNTQTGQELSISNFCVLNTITPNFTVGATICSNAGAINLLSLINDTDPTTTGAAVVDPIGTVAYYYTVNGGVVETPIVPDGNGDSMFNPGDYTEDDTFKIIAKYTPASGNVVDCDIIREATGSFTIINCPLSVNLLDFKARVFEDAVALNWKTSNEKDFSHFEIQKGLTLKEFATIGSVVSNNGSFYNFSDKNPASDNNYYRLKMINNDGSFDYSKVISINYEKSKNFISIENPSDGSEINIATNMKNPRFTLLNQTGVKIEVTTISNGLNKFVVKPVNKVSGLYFLNILSEGKVSTRKVIIP